MTKMCWCLVIIRVLPFKLFYSVLYKRLCVWYSGAQVTLVCVWGIRAQTGATGFRSINLPPPSRNARRNLFTRVVLCLLLTAYRHSIKKILPERRRAGAFCNLNETHCIHYGLCAHKKGTSQFAISWRCYTSFYSVLMR